MSLFKFLFYTLGGAPTACVGRAPRADTKLPVIPEVSISRWCASTRRAVAAEGSWSKSSG